MYLYFNNRYWSRQYNISNSNFNSKCFSPLHEAFAKRHYKTFKVLLENGADVDLTNQQGLNGFTPLHVATYKGHLDVVKLFIQKNANINIFAKTNYDHTTLDLALLNGNFAIIKLFWIYFNPMIPPSHSDDED